MKAEYTEEDFKDAISNPFYEKLNREVIVPVRHEVYQIFCDIGKQNGVEPATVPADHDGKCCIPRTGITAADRGVEKTDSAPSTEES